MKSSLPANAAALLGRVVMPRDFLEITVRNRSTGAAVIERIWSDRFDITASVQDVDSGTTVSASWSGAGGLVDMDPIPRVASLTVQQVDMRLMAGAIDTDRILRTYDPHQAKVRMWRGYLNTDTRELVAPAEPLFFGFVDDIDMTDPAAGGEWWHTLTLVSHTQEASRSNPEMRSDASQRNRSATDNFFADAASVGDWELFWGQLSGKVTTTKATKPTAPTQIKDHPDGGR